MWLCAAKAGRGAAAGGSSSAGTVGRGGVASGHSGGCCREMMIKDIITMPEPEVGELGPGRARPAG